MSREQGRAALQAVSVVGLALCAAAAIWGYRSGVLTSREAMAALVGRWGAAGPALFTLFQAVQVVIPIVPGGLTCLAGVMLFGAWKGFLCNYVGICIGSMLAFSIAKTCGRPLLPKLFSEKLIDRYESWTDENSPFARWFALAIFLPVAPDDFLCYLAGTTAMKYRTFTAIIWLCKPVSISLYSLGLTLVWERLTGAIIR